MNDSLSPCSRFMCTAKRRSTTLFRGALQKWQKTDASGVIPSAAETPALVIDERVYHGRTFGGRRALISEAFPLVTLCPSSLIDGSQLKSTNTGLCSEALKHHPETPSLCLLWIASLTCLFAFSDAFSFFFCSCQIDSTS